jgi:beta-lactamase superfamily II metal-dependent hydrolase
LLSGDSSSEIEDALIPSLLPTDVVLASHHGSDGSSSLAFLQALNPAAVLVSCGRDNPYGFPEKDVLDHIRAVKANLYRTDLQGTVICQTDGIDLSWNTTPCTDFSPGQTQDVIPSLNPIEPSETSDADRSPDPTTESYYV